MEDIFQIVRETAPPLNSTDQAAALREAKRLYRLGRYAEAIAAARNVSAQAEQSPEAELLVVRVEDIPEEIRSQIDWCRADALSQLALAEMMLWRLDDAREHNARAVAEYRHLEENEKALAVALRNRACIELLETRFAEAEALLDEAASLGPRNQSA
jgi:tetratricopeptide (TPR) repeat protein